MGIQVRGSRYLVVLVLVVAGFAGQSSIAVGWYVPRIDPEDLFPYRLSLTKDFEVSRTGELGERLVWVIEKDGNVVLKRNAANELRYRYFRNSPGSSFKVRLEMFIGGRYQQVSNSVKYEVPPGS